MIEVAPARFTDVKVGLTTFRFLRNFHFCHCFLLLLSFCLFFMYEVSYRCGNVEIILPLFETKKQFFC